MEPSLARQIIIANGLPNQTLKAVEEYLEGAQALLDVLIFNNEGDAFRQGTIHGVLSLYLKTIRELKPSDVKVDVEKHKAIITELADVMLVTLQMSLAYCPVGCKLGEQIDQKQTKQAAIIANLENQVAGNVDKDVFGNMQTLQQIVDISRMVKDNHEAY